MIDDGEKVQALESGILTLTGGRCVTGNLILSIPTNKLEDLSQWSTERIHALFVHLSTISKYLKSPKDDSLAVSQNLPLACLADLRHASTPAIKQLTESMESVEHQQRGTICAVYFLKPRSKAKSRMLKKMLGVKISKKRPRIPLFKVVLMKTVQELHTHIDVSQLTADFCGILRYNHDSWMHLYSAVIRCIEGCHNLLTKLPSIRDKVDLLQEYETDGQTSSQVQQLLADLIEKFHIILSESSLPLYLTLSKQTLFLLDHPSSDSQLPLVHPELISGLRSHLHGVYSELDQWNTDLEDTWRVTESRLTVLIQIHRHRERAKEIERKICEHYHPLLREHPIVGKTLSQAELYRAHFTTSLYDPAKELLSQATEILEAVQRLKSSVATRPKSSTGRHDSTNTHSGSVISDQDISDISKCLTTSIQPFTSQLQQLQQVYVSIHIFHLLFEKALIWYKKVLKFIPESLLQMCTIRSDLSAHNLSLYNIPSQTRECLVYMPSEWLGAVRVFLSRHPPPRQEHIDRIDESIPQLVDRKMRSQARSLALRLRLLQRILTSTHLPLKVVTAVLVWRTELFGPSQQEKTSGIHHQTLPAKDGVNAGFSTKQESHQSEKIAARGQSRPHISRVPEKPPRAKKLSNVDREAHPRTRPSSFLLVAATGGPTTEELRVPEKLPGRRNSSKLLPRSKSVDFNFNSSSTDGSVFDYDKALVQAEIMTDAVRAKAVSRKSRSSIKETKSFHNQTGDLKTMWKDDQPYSDPSELISIESRAHILEGRSENQFQDMQRSYTSEPGNEKSKYSLLGNKYVLKKNHEAEAIPEPEPNSSTSLGSSQDAHPKLVQQLHRGKEKPFPLNHSAVTPDSNERFIRITLTPKQISASSKPAFRFGNEDVQETTGSNRFNDEQDSSTDGNLVGDPYDSIVNKIKEISASNLTNIEKLKKVSKLLSSRTLERDTNLASTLASGKASKISSSTMDLRMTGQDRDKKPLDSKSDYLMLNQNQVEKPIEAVLRMKKNLAKSMGELNLPAAYYSNDNSSEQNPSITSESSDGKRSLPQPKTLPGYSKTSEVTNRRHSQTYSDPDVKAPKHLSLSRDKESGGPHSWSDVESFSQGVSASLSSQDPTSLSKQSPSSFFDSSPNTADDGFSKTMISRFIPDDSDPDRHHLNDDVTSEERKMSVIRPATLNLLSSRNFISPSFLRMASSMKDLSTCNHPEMNLDKAVDIEQDYQALEDLEILRTMQDEPLSKDFSKYASKPPRRNSNDQLIDKFQDELRRGESSHKYDKQSQNLKKKSQNTTKREPKYFPEINVGHYSEEWPDFETHGEDCLPYISASDINFSRLTSEADKEYLSQEEVAESLRKTQEILQEEETRRFQRLHPLSDPSLDEEEGNDLLGAAGGLSHTTSLDNGYGSWASKLMHNTSSERDWRKLSTSSADSSSRLPRKTISNNVHDSDGEDNAETSDIVPELPQIEKPLSDPELY